MVAAMKSRLFSKCQKPVGVHRIRMLSDNMGGSMTTALLLLIILIGGSWSHVRTSRDYVTDNVI